MDLENDRFVTLTSENFTQYGHAMYAIEKELPNPYSLETIQSYCHNPTLVDCVSNYGTIMLAKEQLVGYWLGQQLFNEWHLHNIVIGLQHRGQGLGTQLLMHCLDQAAQRGCDRCLLEVLSTNQSAIALYEKFQFKVSGRRKQYYPIYNCAGQIIARGDALLYEKYL